MGNKKRPVSSNTSESESDDSSFDENNECDLDYKHNKKLKASKKTKKLVRKAKPKSGIVDKRGLMTRALNSNGTDSVDKSITFGAINDRRGLLSQAIQKCLENRAQNSCSSSSEQQPVSSIVSHSISTTKTKITHCEYPNCTQNIVSEPCGQCAKVLIHKPKFCKDHIAHRIHLSYMLGDTLPAPVTLDDNKRKVATEVNKSAKLSRTLTGQFRSPTPPKGYKPRIAVSPSHDDVVSGKISTTTSTVKRHRSPSPVVNIGRNQDIRQRGHDGSQLYVHKRQRSPSPVRYDDKRSKADDKYHRRSTRSRSRTRSKSPHRSVSISPAPTRHTAPDPGVRKSSTKDEKRQRSLSPRVVVAPPASRGRGKDATLPAWMTSTVVTSQNDRRRDSSPAERRRDSGTHCSRDRYADAPPPRRSGGGHGDDCHNIRKVKESNRNRFVSPSPASYHHRSRGNDHVAPHDHYHEPLQSPSTAPSALPVAGIIPEWAKGQPKAETYTPSWAKNSRLYEKRFGTANDDEPPGAAKKGAAIGRGRGRDMTQPAWMTEKSATSIQVTSVSVPGLDGAGSGNVHEHSRESQKRDDRSSAPHEKQPQEKQICDNGAILLPCRRNPDLEDGEVCDTPDKQTHQSQRQEVLHDDQHEHHEQQQHEQPQTVHTSTASKSAGFIPQWATTPYGSKEAAVPAWKKDTSAMERALEKRRLAREQLQQEREKEQHQQ